MISLLLGPGFSHILIQVPKQSKNIALKHVFGHIFVGLHILSTAEAYVCVIAVQHFLNDSHGITKTRLFKYTENLTTKKWKFSEKKNSDIFYISAQNIDRGYPLEPPWRGGSNEYSQSMF